MCVSIDHPSTTALLAVPSPNLSGNHFSGISCAAIFLIVVVLDGLGGVVSPLLVVFVRGDILSWVTNAARLMV